MNAAAAPRTAKKKRARWALIVLVLALLTVAGIATSTLTRGSQQRLGEAPTTTVVSSGLEVTAAADGQTEFEDTYDVYPDVSGTVETIEVSLGERVEAGDTLFTIDDDSLAIAARQAHLQFEQAKQQFAQAKQQLAQADLQYEKARHDLEALRSLPTATSATAEQVEQAERAVDVARAGVANAKAMSESARVARANAEISYEDARDDLSMVRVLAPADGVVTAINVVEGGAVSTGGSVGGVGAGSSAAAAGGGSSAPVVIADDSKMIVTVAVNEVDIADVAEGQEATVTFDAADGLAIAARVRWVSPNSSMSGNVRTYAVELELAEQSGRLRAGMTATADIATLRLDDVLVVPKTAVRVDGARKYVTVVGVDGAQERRTVTTGRSDELRSQILTGLQVGERVATSFVVPEQTTGPSLIPPSPGPGMGGN